MDPNSSDIGDALVLLGVGMITVFLILALVVISGSILVRIVNKYAPEPVKKLKRASRSASGTAPEVIAAIAAVVETVTGGHGKVESIKKIEH